MSATEQVRRILAEVLQLGDKATGLDADTPLLGNLPELDSMAVVNLVTAIEDQFDIVIDDDEISAETFETFGSLCDFVAEKMAA
ncbi:acyl carrier protein [Govanella unica]|uniref:Acyl carrier protein n=1 Tax=Govanella unica TaxID=2975056 RepID=A0A9X3Z745_9PROT|nr:acyl carrier protein [Govania unica]MDA5193594.1 acyl carrier protein [Govania unica]